MTSIDWSKAPAWAKSLCLNPAHEQAWLGDEGYSYLIGNGHMVEWTNECAFDHSAFKLVEARPTPWDGQGLPPVGLECLFTAEDNGDGWSEELKPGTKVRVIAQFATTDSVQAAAFTFFSPRLNCHLVEQAIAGCFKPLPTAEQIAAEERKKTIQEMLDVDQCGTLSRTKFCNLLYDAGYRKGGSHAQFAQLGVEIVAWIREVAGYKGDGPHTTPWQEIVRTLSQEARALVAKIDGSAKA